MLYDYVCKECMERLKEIKKTLLNNQYLSKACKNASDQQCLNNSWKLFIDETI